MEFFYYLITRLISKDRVERHFAYTICLIFLNSAIYILISPDLKILNLLVCNIWSFLILLFIYIIYNLQLSPKSYNSPAEFSKFALLVILLLTHLIFYIGSNTVQKLRYVNNRNLENSLWDQELLKVDSLLLGSVFPRGQLALYLDTNTVVGVTSTTSFIYVEILEWCYVSYYFWGNALVLYLAYYYYQNIEYCKIRKRLIYRLILMVLTSWLSGFFLNLGLNMIFPAVSPRIFLQGQYRNKLQGFLFYDLLSQNIGAMAIDTFGSFPSTHCSLSWLIVVIAFRLQRFRTISLIMAILISIATLVLRYHYFVDFLASFLVVVISSWIGGFHRQRVFDFCIELDSFDPDKFNFEIFKVQDYIDKV